jgi:hypothetical protein
VNNETMWDERVVAYINPLHGYFPAILRGPKLYFPGSSTRGVDWEW